MRHAQRCLLSLSLLMLTNTLAPARADDWPQWLGPKRDGVWRETGLLDKFPEGGPKVRWRVPVGAGYSGPAVAAGRVYLTDRVRPEGAENRFTNGPGKERILCLEEASGKILWKHEYDCPYQLAYPLGPRATPLVNGDKVYTLGAMGDLLCFNAKTGEVLWSKNFPKDLDARVPQWGFAAHPLLDGDRLICLVGGKEQAAVAFHKDTGKVLWHALTAREVGYCPPIIIRVGEQGPRQLIIWHPEAVNSLDPETGKLNWSQPFAVNAGLTIPTPRLSGDLLFVTSFYNGSMMLRLDHEKPAAKLLWKSKGRGERPGQTESLHSIMTTPYIADGYIYGVCSYGELRCLKAETGERVWESMAATGGQSARWGHAFLIPQGERFFIFNEHGDLIIARLTPKGYEEISKAHLVDPTNRLANRPVVWSHPAFANRCVYARNDKELVCVSLER